MKPMKLIDASQLIDDIDGDLTDAVAERMAIRKIENAPVIEAIPVEWIENYADDLANKEKLNPFAYRGYEEGAEWIRNMLRNLREEK